MSYEDGLPSEIRRYDGTVLHVKRDALGRPVGLKLGDNYQGAFFVDPKLGAVFGENLKLVEADGGFSVQMNDKTIVYPNNQDEAMTFPLYGNLRRLEDRGLIVRGRSKDGLAEWTAAHA